MAEPAKLERRVTQLEELLSHHEHEYQQLNDVVLQLRSDFDTLKHWIIERVDRLESITEDPSTAQRPDDKPPHY